MQAPFASRFSGLLVGLVLLLVLFAPMVAIHVYGATLELGERPAAGEVTVGIAVILRATARRLLRGASSNLMRTTAGALGRTSARALVRRFVKLLGRLFFSSVVHQSAESSASEEEKERPATARTQLTALGLGFVGLCLSFWGVLRVVDVEVVTNIVGGSGLRTLEVVLLAGVPLLAYAALHEVFGRVFGVHTRYRTEIDGLLLQGYFTGAGSFLPLTTDIDYTGSERGKRFVAMGSILGMFAIHAALVLAGNAAGSAHLSFLGTMFLVYCFVYCFPIKPLEGYFIWSSSKLQWVLVTLPILVAFLSWLPPAFGEIL